MISSMYEKNHKWNKHNLKNSVSYDGIILFQYKLMHWLKMNYFKPSTHVHHSMRKTISHSYETAGRIIVLLRLMPTFL